MATQQAARTLCLRCKLHNEDRDAAIMRLVGFLHQEKGIKHQGDWDDAKGRTILMEREALITAAQPDGKQQISESQFDCCVADALDACDFNGTLAEICEEGT